MGYWKKLRIADVAAQGPNSLATGPFGSSIGSRFFRPSGVPVIRGGNLSADSAVRINDKNLVFLDQGKAVEFTRSTVRNGDLIFTSWGTINQVGLIDRAAAYDEYVISNKQMKLTPDPKIAVPEFLYYLFSGPSMQREILDGSIGSSIPGFNLTRLRSLEVLLPPIGEQKRIARALADAELLETKLCALIYKKKAVKVGIMQQILSGATLIPGCSGKLRDRRLADVCIKIQDGTHFSPKLGGSGFKYVTSKNIGRGELKLDGIENISEGEHKKIYARCDVKFGDLLLTKDGANTGNAALNAFREEVSLLSSVAFIRCNPAMASEAYVMHYLLSHHGRRQIEDAMAGNAITRLTLQKIRNLMVPMPSIDDQRVIVRALSIVDSEISILRRRLAKARAIKLGMMQQLLTGSTRLPVKGSA